MAETAADKLDKLTHALDLLSEQLRAVTDRGRGPLTGRPAAGQQPPAPAPATVPPAPPAVTQPTPSEDFPQGAPTSRPRTAEQMEQLQQAYLKKPADVYGATSNLLGAASFISPAAGRIAAAMNNARNLAEAWDHFSRTIWAGNQKTVAPGAAPGAAPAELPAIPLAPPRVGNPLPVAPLERGGAEPPGLPLAPPRDQPKPLPLEPGSVPLPPPRGPQPKPATALAPPRRPPGPIPAGPRPPGTPVKLAPPRSNPVPLAQEPVPLAPPRPLPPPPQARRKPLRVIKSPHAPPPELPPVPLAPPRPLPPSPYAPPPELPPVPPANRPLPGASKAKPPSPYAPPPELPPVPPANQPLPGASKAKLPSGQSPAERAGALSSAMSTDNDNAEETNKQLEKANETLDKIARDLSEGKKKQATAEEVAPEAKTKQQEIQPPGHQQFNNEATAKDAGKGMGDVAQAVEALEALA